jgi:hypothetical protein
MPLAETQYDEFQAFDGQIALIVHPDGSIE